MKKLLLTALLGVFGFVGAFASAGNITFTSSTTEWESFPYSPSSFTISENVSFNYSSVSSSFNCDESASYAGCCTIGIRSEQDFESDIICSIESDSDDSYSSCSLTPGTYYVSLDSSDCIAYSSITLPVGSSSSGGGDSSSSSDSPLLSGGTAQLVPVINSIFSVMGEFIPYVVYISIGILVATLGFYAIKRLMNWMYGKIKKYFR